MTNKRAVSHLIISGAFDRVEGIVKVEDRYQLLENYYKLENEKIKEEYLEMGSWTESSWIMKQKELTGFGLFNFSKIIHQSELVNYLSKYKDNSTFLQEDFGNLGTVTPVVLVCGLLVGVIERSSRNGKFGQLEIQDNSSTIYITCWNETYEGYREVLKHSTNRIVLLTGNPQYDTYKNQNVIHTNKNSKIQII